MNRAGPEAPLPCTTNPLPPLKTTPVGPPGTATVSACRRPSAAYSVLVLRPSFETHHGPSRLAARPQGLTSWESARSVTSARFVKRSKRALLADAVATSATTTTANAQSFTSPGRDRRGLRRALSRSDEVAVPVEAVLRHTLEGRVVDVDDPEALRVAVRPLEVVEQAPHEVALHRRPVGDRLRDGRGVRLEVRGPLGIVHAPVVDADVAERGAVLGDVDRLRGVVLRDPDEELMQAVGIDLPTHVGVLRLLDALHPRPVRARADDEPEVVVDAEIVERGRDRCEVAVPEDRHDQLVALEEVGRVGALEERVEEPAVRLPVDLPGRGLVLRALAGGIRVREIERDPDLRLRHHRADHFDRPAVRKEEVVRRGDGIGLARAPRRVLAPRVPDPGVHPRLVVRDPVPYAVAEAARDGFRVLGERLRGRARGPAARVLERLRRVPVEERRERLDVVREQLVDEAVVEVEAGLVDRTAARRHDPRPRDREPERVEPELAHQLHVLGIPVVEVARPLPGVAVPNLPRRGAEAVPDAFSASVLLGRALDLVRRRGGAPEEVGRERALLGMHRCPLGQFAGAGAVTWQR